MRRCPLMVFARLTLWMGGDLPAAAQNAGDNWPRATAGPARHGRRAPSRPQAVVHRITTPKR